jgi:hypothetical protein
MISLLCITNGRKDLLIKTLESFKESVLDDPLVTQKIIVCDTNDEDFKRWALVHFASLEFNVCFPETRLGFAGSIQRGWNQLDLKNDYVFHLEDDFALVKPVQLQDLVTILQRDPTLAQVSLLRNPCNNQEVIAGGLINLWPNEYTQRGCRVQPNGKSKGVGYQVFWLDQNLYFTTNPSLYPTKITSLGWPLLNNSEAAFTKALKERGFKFGVYGQKTDSHRVLHLGTNRTAESFGY